MVGGVLDLTLLDIVKLPGGPNRPTGVVVGFYKGQVGKNKVVKAIVAPAANHSLEFLDQVEADPQKLTLSRQWNWNSNNNSPMKKTGEKRVVLDIPIIWEIGTDNARPIYKSGATNYELATRGQESQEALIPTLQFLLFELHKKYDSCPIEVVSYSRTNTALSPTATKLILQIAIPEIKLGSLDRAPEKSDFENSATAEKIAQIQAEFPKAKKLWWKKLKKSKKPAKEIACSVFEDIIHPDCCHVHELPGKNLCLLRSDLEYEQVLVNKKVSGEENSALRNHGKQYTLRDVVNALIECTEVPFKMQANLMNYARQKFGVESQDKDSAEPRLDEETVRYFRDQKISKIELQLYFQKVVNSLGDSRVLDIREIANELVKCAEVAFRFDTNMLDSLFMPEGTTRRVGSVRDQESLTDAERAVIEQLYPDTTVGEVVQYWKQIISAFSKVKKAWGYSSDLEVSALSKKAGKQSKKKLGGSKLSLEDRTKIDENIAVMDEKLSNLLRASALEIRNTLPPESPGGNSNLAEFDIVAKAFNEKVENADKYFIQTYIRARQTELELLKALENDEKVLGPKEEINQTAVGDGYQFDKLVLDSSLFRADILESLAKHPALSSEDKEGVGETLLGQVLLTTSFDRTSPAEAYRTIQRLIDRPPYIYGL